MQPGAVGGGVGKALGRVVVGLVLVTAGAVTDAIVLFAPAGELLTGTDVGTLAVAACVAGAAVVLLPEQWVLGAPPVGAALAVVAAVTGVLDVPDDPAVLDAQGGIGIVLVAGAQYGILCAALVARGAMKVE